MKILVTGADGFIGRHLSEELETSEHSITRVGYGTHLNHDLAIGEYAAMYIYTSKPDFVVHLAGRPGRLFGEIESSATLESNVITTLKVAKACYEYGVPLALASSSEVYGDHNGHWCDETSETQPINFYGITKLWAEQVARLYLPDALILRLAMPYGPGHPAGRGRAAITNFLHKAICKQPINVHANAERSWCYVSDTCRAIRFLLETNARGIYNVGSTDARSMWEVGVLACEIADAPVELLQLDETPPGQSPIKRLSMDKLSRDTEFTPLISLEQGMQITHDWLWEMEAIA